MVLIMDCWKCITRGLKMIELNKIILADCMDIMKDIPDKYFELAIVENILDNINP